MFFSKISEDEGFLSKRQAGTLFSNTMDPGATSTWGYTTPILGTRKLLVGFHQKCWQFLGLFPLYNINVS